MNRQDPFAPSLELKLFNGVELLVDGRPPTAKTPRKVLSAIARLALAPGNRVPRASLASDLWPDAEGENLRQFYLRRTLTDLRKLLQEHRSLLTPGDHDSIYLDLDACTVDVARFDAAVASRDPRVIEAAIGIYTGPLLAGFSEPWIVYEREKRWRAYLRGINLLRNQAKKENNLAWVIEICRMPLAFDPLQESEQRALIRALADSGDLTGAEKQYRRFESLLKKRTGRAPEVETCDLYQRISVGSYRSDQLDPEPIAAQAGSRGDFPRPITPILGRDRDTQRLCSMIRANRLVTITAAGGFGKTRLSLHLAEMLACEFPGGVWFVDLAPLTDPRLVLNAIANALQLQERSGQSALQTLKANLQFLPTMLILDNCEHIREGCASAAMSLLSASSKLQILATSRQSLGVTGEALYRLGPLAVPDSKPSISSDAETEAYLKLYPSLSLFIERARARGSFEFTSGAIGAIGRICKKLEGNALALEIAAAQTRVYGVLDLEHKLDSLLESFVNESPLVLPRQRTLAALIGWSFDLLPPTEAHLLARLSVFRGSWALAAAAEVCGEDGIDTKSVPTLVASLVDKSMVQTLVTASGSIRFRLLEMVRLYSERRLKSKYEETGGEIGPVQARFLEYYLGLGENLMLKMRTTEQNQALDAMEAENDNIRAALEYSIEAGNSDYALRFANSMWRYWQVRGHYTEGMNWYARALALPAAANTLLAGDAVFYAGNVAFAGCRYREARVYYERYLEHAVQVKNPVLVATARGSIGLVLDAEGQYSDAIPIIQQAIDQFRTLGKSYLMAVCMANVGGVYANLGDFPRAILMYQQALDILSSAAGTYDYVHPMVMYGCVLAEAERVPEALNVLNVVTPQAFALGGANEIGLVLIAYISVALTRELSEQAARLLGAHAAYRDLFIATDSALEARILLKSRSFAADALKEGFKHEFENGYKLYPELLEEYLKRTFH